MGFAFQCHSTARIGSRALIWSFCFSYSDFVCLFSWSFFLLSAARLRTVALHQRSPRIRAARGSSLQRAPRFWPPDESGLVRAKVRGLRAAEESNAEKDLKTPK